ncbi:MAG: NADH-quinone oxidoreductase subunit J [Terriglobia bacterium]
MGAEAYVFFVFAGLAVLGALNLIIQRHPIHSALSLILVMGSLAVHYLLLGAEFVAAVQIIVYAGAIMVLFIFVIMLLNAGEEEHTDLSLVAKYAGLPLAVILLGVLAYQFSRVSPPQAAVDARSFVGGTTSLARLLFRDFVLPFELTSILILIAILGAIVLAKKEL